MVESYAGFTQPNPVIDEKQSERSVLPFTLWHLPALWPPSENQE
jgi:hypothetical protein